jgi:hypothetical protein
MPSDENVVSESVLEKEVAGEYTTFRVYLYLLKVMEASPRQVYRVLELSSPSLALHHLEKLEGFGLVHKDEYGKYHGVRRRFGVLRFFVVTGKWLIPRTFFYIIFYVLTAIGSLFILPSGVREAALILSLFGVVTNLVETLGFFRVLP